MTLPPPGPPSTGNAVAREAWWLAGYSPDDGLPALSTANGGPFDVVQGYSPRTPNLNAAGLYLRRVHLVDERWANQRKLSRHSFTIKALWPLGTSTATGSAETEQANFDAAINLTIVRIRDLRGDHTHGGQFLSVAEAPSPAHIEVVFTDPDTTMPNRYLRADISYHADDPETFI